MILSSIQKKAVVNVISGKYEYSPWATGVLLFTHCVLFFPGKLLILLVFPSAPVYRGSRDNIS